MRINTSNFDCKQTTIIKHGEGLFLIQCFIKKEMDWDDVVHNTSTGFHTSRGQDTNQHSALSWVFLLTKMSRIKIFSLNIKTMKYKCLYSIQICNIQKAKPFMNKKYNTSQLSLY